MLGELLALLSAALSGLSVVSVRRHSSGSTAFIISLVVTVTGSLLLWPFALVEWRFSYLTLGGFGLFALSGILGPGLVRLFYYKGLKDLGASVNSSVFAIYPVYALLPAVFLLNEAVTILNLLGMAAIISGVIFIERCVECKNGGPQTGWKGIITPVLGGLMLGGAIVFRKIALDISPAPILGVAIAYLFSLVPYLLALIVFVRKKQNISLKTNTRLFWPGGVGLAISWLLAFYSLSLGQISIIAPLQAVEPLFVVAFAYFYLKHTEIVSTKLAASIIITVIGIILIII
jgi:drug/metabolite transporter (DMT)-like permease